MDKQARRDKWLRDHKLPYGYGKASSKYIREHPLADVQFRNKEIIHLRTIDKMMLQYIADKYGLSRARVQQICADAGLSGKIIGLKRSKSMEKKIIKLMISFTQEQSDALDKLMSADLLTNRSEYVASLVGGEVKRREAEKEKRGVGRPRKEESGGIDSEPDIDYTDDIPKNIPHFGRTIGKREYADIKQRAEDFKRGL